MTETSIDQVLHSQSNGPTDRISKPSSSSPRTHNGSISSASGSGNNAPNPRSCVTCRRRKVKCDKRHPCTNCTKARIECVFPSPGRAPRKSRKPPDAELLERLRKLEGVVKTLGGSDAADGLAQLSTVKPENTEGPASKKSNYTVKHESENVGCPSGKKDLPSEDHSLTGLETRFGRLVVDSEEGRSRYINSNFWASLNNEVEDIKELLAAASDDEEDYPSPESENTSNNPNHQSFVFGYSSVNVDMLSLHPPPEHCRAIWEMFKENIDPVMKVLHIPTAEPKVLAAMEDREHIPKGMEALLFAIYYAVVTSKSSQDCENLFGEDKQALLARYRFGLEQGLARANFLQSDESIVLQAFVVFLICLRRNEDARIIWTLTGLVVRIAQTLGLHRDGTHFGLSPFAVEMRRRLWWQVCILDVRTSEDAGCDPTIVEGSFDTKMPLNINDEDLDPDMKEFPEERQGCTEMTFCLIRYEVTSIYRRIHFVPAGSDKCNRYFASVSLEQKEQWITDVHKKVEECYLRHADMSVPLYWVTATVARLMMSKMWLMIYHPFQRLDGGASLPQETKDKLFVTSLENIEYALLLENEPRTEKWGWLFRTYMQWHAIAFLLTELCVRTKGELVERAWRAIETTAQRRWADLSSDQKKGYLWRPLKKLVTRAKAAREGELQRQRAALAQAQAQARMQAYSNQTPLALDLYPQAQTTPPGLAADLSSSMHTPTQFSTPQPPHPPPPSTLSTNSTPTLTNFSPGLMNPAFASHQQHPQLQTQLHQQHQQHQTHQQHHQPQGLDLATSTPPFTQGFDTTNLDWLLRDPLDASPTNASTTTAGPNGIGVNSGGGNGGSSTGASPMLGDDALNWANWDDMVAQYGMDAGPGTQPGLHGQDQGQGMGYNHGQGMGMGMMGSGFQTWY